MSFDADYLDEDEIWVRIDELIEQKNEISQRLSRPQVSTDPDKVAKSSRKLDGLKEISELAEKLRSGQEDLSAAEAILSEGKDEEAQDLVQEYRDKCDKLSNELFELLMDNGHLEEEAEDEIDVRILKYIQLVGPEYAIQLAKNLNLEVEQARDRLETLNKKDLLTRVQGTMLESYHRQEGWDKHMNHTYYRLSRQGELYLRDLRNSNR